MKPDDLFQLMPNVDFGVPVDEVRELPELPKFTGSLRRRLEREVVLYGKPALSIDNLNWGWLYLILAAHERSAIEAEALDAFFPTLLSRDARASIGDVRDALRRTTRVLHAALRQVGVRHLLEGSADGLAHHIESATAIVEQALESDAKKRAHPQVWADEDGSGRLQELLGKWWQHNTRNNRRPSLSKGGKKNGAPSAYLTFLTLCFGVLSKPPTGSVSADTMIRRRTRRNAEKRARELRLRRIQTSLPSNR